MGRSHTALELVFSLLQQHQLFLKKSKCSLATTEVAYLGHIVTQGGVKVDESKIWAISQWPQPTTVRTLRGFLGLAGYYRKFVKDYGTIAAPLTKLLRNNSFAWDEESARAFKALQLAMSDPPKFLRIICS